MSSPRAHRPEIVQANKLIASDDSSLAAARYERRPTLTASASTQWNPGTDLSNEPQPVWAAGVTLSWSLWDGGKSNADVRLADATLKSAYASRDALLVTVTSQLDSARSQILANKANVSASTEAVTAARAELQLAEAQYTQGLGSQIVLADAQTAVTTAEGDCVPGPRSGSSPMHGRSCAARSARSELWGPTCSRRARCPRRRRGS